MIWAAVIQFTYHTQAHKVLMKCDVDVDVDVNIIYQVSKPTLTYNRSIDSN